ncbi:MAG: 50S ribosomal protein L20 [Myxococcota bacterium]|jgi:large subunit ribosomal protein L20|nr:50S ribosomal protein L20 [Myxococcota bacterium]
MARVKRGFKARRRRNRILKRAQGFFGSRSRLFKVAHCAVLHAWKDAYVGRKLRKRDMRRLWITRIGAAARNNGTSYSRLMGDLRKADVMLDRKILADLAVSEPQAFAAVIEFSKAGR